MTNRDFILKCIAGLSDERLLDLWDTIFDGSNTKPPIVTACNACMADHGMECPGGVGVCVLDAGAWMKREVVLRSG